MREKLGESESPEPKGGPSPVLGLILAVLVFGGGAALFLSMRASAAKEKAAAAERARLSAAAAAAESIAAAARADSMRIAAAADSAAANAKGKTTSAPGGKSAAAAKAPAPAAMAKPSPAASHAAASPVATAPPVAKPTEKGPFGLDVGTFLVEERANSELEKLAAATGLRGKVVTKSEDGSDVFHVVLGSFPTRAAAERKAGALVGDGKVNQAKPISLAS